MENEFRLGREFNEYPIKTADKLNPKVDCKGIIWKDLVKFKS